MAESKGQDVVFAPLADSKQSVVDNFLKAFAELDENKNGFIEVNELRDFIASRLQDPKCSRRLKKYFSKPENVEKHIEDFLKQADTNKDGKVSTDEYRSYYVSKRWRCIPSLKVEIAKMFDYFDTDKDGFIDANDLDQLLKKTAEEDSDAEDYDDPANRKQFIEDFMTELGRTPSDKASLEEYTKRWIDELKE